MTTAYIVERWYGYEGFNILGVFESKSDAKKAIDEDSYDPVDWYEIEEFEIIPAST